MRIKSHISKQDKIGFYLQEFSNIMQYYILEECILKSELNK